MLIALHRVSRVPTVNHRVAKELGMIPPMNLGPHMRRKRRGR
jgi:hypothetical protein